MRLFIFSNVRLVTLYTQNGHLHTLQSMYILLFPLEILLAHRTLNPNFRADLQMLLDCLPNLTLPAILTLHQGLTTNFVIVFFGIIEALQLVGVPKRA